MRNKRLVQRMVWGYVLLIGLAILQELLVYIHVFREQSLAIVDLGFSIGCLAALLLGFLARRGLGRFYFCFIWLRISYGFRLMPKRECCRFPGGGCFRPMRPQRRLSRPG